MGKTLEIILPFGEPGKPDLNPPVYVVRENALGGPEKARWICPGCSKVFRNRNRKACMKHMGKISPLPASCPIYDKI